MGQLDPSDKCQSQSIADPMTLGHYIIQQTNYYKTRIFPKLISNKTDMFRYYSCLFRVAQFKKATARAVILRNILYCYTIEASTGFYYDSIEKKDVPFTPEKWMLMV